MGLGSLLTCVVCVVASWCVNSRVTPKCVVNIVAMFDVRV